MFVNNLDQEIIAGNILALVSYLPYGTKQDRNVGCNNVDSVASHFITGNKQLLQQGAFPIKIEADVKFFLERNTVPKIKRNKDISDFFKSAKEVSLEKK